jgi:hypothetical protein
MDVVARWEVDLTAPTMIWQARLPLIRDKGVDDSAVRPDHFRTVRRRAGLGFEAGHGRATFGNNRSTSKVAVLLIIIVLGGATKGEARDVVGKRLGILVDVVETGCELAEASVY